MMELKDLITYNNLIENIDTAGIEDGIHKSLTQFNNDLNIQDINFDKLKESMFEKQQNILENLSGLQNDLNKFKLEMKQYISTFEQPYHIMSEEIYKKSQLNVHIRHSIAKDNNLLHNDDIKGKFFGCIKKYVSYTESCLQIAPVLGDMTDELVALDPLYLADNNIDMFSEVKINKLWNPIYRKRLRYYLIDDEEEDPLHQLPKNQLGLIVAVDWFNFKPMRIIEKYLASMMSVLRPGGVAVFTFNNCNYPKAVDKVNEMQYCYTNGNTLREFCKSIGYDVLSSYNGEPDITLSTSWLEIQKPGSRTSIRGGQNLGAIKNL
jgi:hypothetical protein